MKVISVGILLLLVGCKSTTPVPVTQIETLNVGPHSVGINQGSINNIPVTIDHLLTYSNRCTVMCDFIAPCTGVIEYKNNLTDTNWVSLWTGVITNTQTISISFTNINIPHQYYRAYTTYP